VHEKGIRKKQNKSRREYLNADNELSYKAAISARPACIICINTGPAGLTTESGDLEHPIDQMRLE
jgi:hypothetical protein